MIALMKNKKPILGVIGWPTENTLFVAQEGKGAFIDIQMKSGPKSQ